MAQWRSELQRLVLSLTIASSTFVTFPHAESLTLTPSLPSDQPVGTTIVWTASLPPQGNRTYQFSVADETGEYVVVRDFQAVDRFAWTPIDEGLHLIRVVVRTGRMLAEEVAPFHVVPRVTATQAVVTKTSHPLVALYSAPPCGDGGRVSVEFAEEGVLSWTRTDTKSCAPGRSRNFYVAGMRAEHTYWMRHVVKEDFVTIRSRAVSFTTGALPSTMPTFTVLDPPDVQSPSLAPVVLHAMLDPAQPRSNFPVATNLAGEVIWYYDQLAEPGTFAYVTRALTGGGMLMLASCCQRHHVVMEIDLAGNTIRQTTMSRINEQLRARGEEPVRALHHEAVRFPNGHTLLIGMLERSAVLPDVPMLADMVIALDANFQVVWTWNGFDYLDANRRAVLGENCRIAYGAACAASSPLAHDWLHSNSLAYSPADGNLIISMRHQDWVVKVDYRDGAGSGGVWWRLGRDGDFALVSSDPYPWFSHQHDARYVGPNRIIVYDNGNTRCATTPRPCNSRGQVYDIDETRRIARLSLNADLGVYSDRLGSAQRLSNGNYAFGSGSIASRVSDTTELTPDGRVTFNLRANVTAYRTFRIRSLYEP